MKPYGSESAIDCLRLKGCLGHTAHSGAPRDAGPRSRHSPNHCPFAMSPGRGPRCSVGVGTPAIVGQPRLIADILQPAVYCPRSKCQQWVRRALYFTVSGMESFAGQPYRPPPPHSKPYIPGRGLLGCLRPDGGPRPQSTSLWSLGRRKAAPAAAVGSPPLRSPVLWPSDSIRDV